MFAEALNSFFESLERYTLADLIGDQQKQQLNLLLNINTNSATQVITNLSE